MLALHACVTACILFALCNFVQSISTWLELPVCLIAMAQQSLIPNDEQNAVGSVLTWRMMAKVYHKV